MKGATAVPSVNTSNNPKINRTIIIGSNQNFFLTFKKLKNSMKKLINFV